MKKSRKIGLVRVRPQTVHGKETGRWFVDVPASLTSNGKRKRRLFDNQTQATEIARELRRRIDPVTGLLIVKPTTSALTLFEAIDGWLRDEALRVKTLKKRASSLETDEMRMRSIRRFFGDCPLSSINETSLSEYQAHRLSLGRKPVTINCETAALSLVLKWAVKQCYLQAAPKPEPIPVSPVRAIIPTPDEVVRIINALPERLRPLIRFLAETGCRRGEAINLTWDCVDEIAGYVEIRSRADWTPKTQNAERRIPVSGALLTMIRGLPKDGVYVFPGKTPDEPIGLFRRSWVSAVRQAQIMRRGVQVHIPVKSLRKAHATWQAERGVPESVLQDLLGHAPGSTVTRKHYVRVTEDAKRAAVIALPLLDEQ